MSQILIVGASGFIGQHLLNVLQDTQGVQAFAATRQSTVEATQRHLDLADPTTYDAALVGIDRVFVLSPGGNVDAYGLVSPFIEALAKHKVEHVVLMTAQGVQYDDTVALRRLELQLQGTGLNHTILRPNWFMQNFQSYWYEGIKHHNTIALPAADAKTAFVDTRDIAEAAAAALINGTQGEYDLTGDVALTYEEAATILSQASNQTIAYQNLPESAFQDILLSAGMDEDYVGMMLWLFQSVRDGFAAQVTDGFTQLTGRPPRSLSTYAQDHASLFA